MLGIAESPLLALAELQEGVIRVPLRGRMGGFGAPAFSVGLEGIEEDAVRIFLSEGRKPEPGEPGSYRVPHVDEGGYRPGLHAVLRSAGSPMGHAVAAAVALALAREAGGVIVDRSEVWIEASGTGAHLPEEFAVALRAERRYASVTDGAMALWARRPTRKAAPTG